MKPMKRPSPPSACARLPILAAGLALCAASALPARARAQHPTPAPPFDLTVEAVKAHGPDVMAHIRRLAFDTLAGADRRRLLKDSSGVLVVGPEAELAAERGARLVKGNWAGWGRILARLTIRGEAYPKLHVGPGVTYICVRRSTKHASAADSLWAYLIGTTSGNASISDSLPLAVTPTAGPARFVPDPSDEGMCFPCNSAWCCAR